MTIQTTPHLNFRGDARAALELYQSVFGGHLVIATHADVGSTDPTTADHVAWGQVATEDGFRVMAFDVWPHLEWDPGTEASYVSVRGDDADELARCWNRLADGATIHQPLEPSSWSPLYGKLTDRFGTIWVLDIAAPQPTD